MKKHLISRIAGVVQTGGMKRAVLAAGLLAGLVATTVILASTAEGPVPPDSRWHLTAVATTYSWVGSCQIRCADGSCEFKCGAGVVVANGDFQARIEAEAAMKQQAAAQGGVPIEGTVKVTITRSGGRCENDSCAMCGPKTPLLSTTMSVSPMDGSPQITHGRLGWRASCYSFHGQKTWLGPIHNNYDDAKADAAFHNTGVPLHTASVAAVFLPDDAKK